MIQSFNERKRKSFEEYSYLDHKKSKIQNESCSKHRRKNSNTRRVDKGYCSKEVSRWRSKSQRRRGDRYERDSGLNSKSHHRSRDRVKDDKDGHLVFEEGDFLHKRYKLGKVLGKGTFGKVVQAEDHDNNRKRVAVKIVRNNRDDYKDAMIEVDILKNLQQSDKANKFVCHMRDSFDYHGHACIVFDQLGSSLYEFMKKNRYQSFFMCDIRKVAYKLCKAIQFIHSHGLAHTDLKPENVLFVDSDYEQLYAEHYEKGKYNWIWNSDVRIIDFGSAVYKEQQRGIVQTRQYRAPEVILGLRWSYPCDIWSIGCILFEMYHGEMLFQTHDSLEHLAIMERILGPFPSKMMEDARDRKGSCYVKGSKLKWDKESKEGLDVRKRFKPFETYIREDRHSTLFDLTRRMLHFDPVKRCTASEALDHPFFHYNDS